MDTKEKKLTLFFERCMVEWERRHGRRPESREEMWDAVIDGMERRCSENPKS